MARPTTKTDLIALSIANYDNLMILCQTLANPDQPFSFVLTKSMTQAHWQRDKTLRDVLIHLYEWHQLVLHWVEANQDGQNTPFFKAPYTWRTYGQLNQEFVAKHQETSLETAKQLLASSHEEMLAIVTTLSNEALFTKQYFPWTGTTTLGSYFASALTSHYEWASKKLKQQIKAETYLKK